MRDAEELLSIYDREVRGSFAMRLPGGWSAEQDGPLSRCVTPRDGFAMLTEATTMSERELAALVDRTIGFYAELGLEWEWKAFDHDRPELNAMLVARGATPEPHEALVLGEAAPLAVDASVPDGLRLVTVADRAGLEAIAEMEATVWGDDRSWLADDLEERLASEEPIEIFAVMDGDLVVSAAWLVPLPGTRVAGLWGGSTLADYRGRGIYRSLVAHRARRAIELGYELLQIDASDDSRPILERLGLTVIGGTTPYIFEAQGN